MQSMTEVYPECNELKYKKYIRTHLVYNYFTIEVRPEYISTSVKYIGDHLILSNTYVYEHRAQSEYN